MLVVDAHAKNSRLEPVRMNDHIALADFTQGKSKLISLCHVPLLYTVSVLVYLPVGFTLDRESCRGWLLVAECFHARTPERLDTCTPRHI